MDSVLVYFDVIINPGENDEDVINTVSTGRIYEKNDALYVIYNEMDEVTLDEFTSVLKIDGEEITLIRYNGSREVCGRMVFAENSVNDGYYGTEQGYVDITTETSRLKTDLTYQEGGKISIDYHIEIVGVVKTRHLLNIEVKKENTDEQEVC